MGFYGEEQGLGFASETFRAQHIPSIEFCALTQSTLQLLHSVDDKVSKINEDDYYNSYHFLSAYLVYVDQVAQSRLGQRSNEALAQEL